MFSFKKKRPTQIVYRGGLEFLIEVFDRHGNLVLSKIELIPEDFSGLTVSWVCKEITEIASYKITHIRSGCSVRKSLPEPEQAYGGGKIKLEDIRFKIVELGFEQKDNQ